MYVSQKAPLETSSHAIFESRQALGRNIARDDDLLVVVVKGVERVEERFLGLGFALKELNVIDEQDVDVAVAGLECRTPVVRNGIDEVVGEFLGAHVLHANSGIETLSVMTNGVQ